VPGDLVLLWSDDTAVVVSKPSGLLVHNSAYVGPKERSLRGLLGEHLGRRVFPVNRIDRGASGVVLFARETEHVAAWQARLAAPGTEKLYLALVRGRLDQPAEVDSPVPDEDGRPHQAQSIVVPLGVSQVDRCSLVGVRLLTGRLHQARRHLRHLGHAVLGDSTYGNSVVNREYQARYGLGRLALHAAELRVIPPGQAAPAIIRADLPADLLTVLRQLFP